MRTKESTRTRVRVRVGEAARKQPQDMSKEELVTALADSIVPDWQKHLHIHHDIARKQRTDLPFDKAMLAVAVMYASDMSTTLIPLPWDSNDEKYQMGEVVSGLARVIQAPAIIFNSDSRSLNPVGFAVEYKIPMGKRGKKDWYERIHEKYVSLKLDSMGDLPPGCWNDIILTSVKGPQIPAMGMMSKYTHQDGRYTFEEAERFGGPDQPESGIQNNIIPDWWEVSVQ